MPLVKVWIRWTTTHRNDCVSPGEMGDKRRNQMLLTKSAYGRGTNGQKRLYTSTTKTSDALHRILISIIEIVAPLTKQMKIWQTMSSRTWAVDVAGAASGKYVVSVSQVKQTNRKRTKESMKIEFNSQRKMRREKNLSTGGLQIFHGRCICIWKHKPPKKKIRFASTDCTGWGGTYYLVIRRSHPQDLRSIALLTARPNSMQTQPWPATPFIEFIIDKCRTNKIRKSGTQCHRVPEPLTWSSRERKICGIRFARETNRKRTKES